MKSLAELFLTFSYLGLTSIGGAWAALPEMQRQVVQVHHWMNAERFAQTYALGQFAPGPNMLQVFVIGFQRAGWPGAMAAGLGMFGLTAAILALVAWLVGRPHPPVWLERMNRAMGPVTVGLMASAAWSMGQGSIHSVFTLEICLGCAIAILQKWLGTSWSVLVAAMLGVSAKAFGLS